LAKLSTVTGRAESSEPDHAILGLPATAPGCVDLVDIVGWSPGQGNVILGVSRCGAMCLGRYRPVWTWWPAPDVNTQVHICAGLLVFPPGSHRVTITAGRAGGGRDRPTPWVSFVGPPAGR